MASTGAFSTGAFSTGAVEQRTSSTGAMASTDSVPAMTGVNSDEKAGSDVPSVAIPKQTLSCNTAEIDLTEMPTLLSSKANSPNEIQPEGFRKCSVSLQSGAESVDEILPPSKGSEGPVAKQLDAVKSGSEIRDWLTKAIVYLIALSLVIFTLVAKSVELGESPSKVGSSSDSHRLLREEVADVGSERRLGSGPSPLMTHIAFSFTSVGIMALTVNALKQPLILGYLLGGVLVGPTVLDIVPSSAAIQELSSLGLVFLLFMIGLELNVGELLKMGKVVLLTGLLQFPICAGFMTCVFVGLEAAGISWGQGKYSAMYVGTSCGISSTMIVVKLLAEKLEMSSRHGRLTVGILIFQDIWAIIVLAIQPNMANPQVFGILKTFAMIIVLLIVAISYAKFVMPAIFAATSKSPELLLVVALAWVFYIGCIATMPFVGLSLELAALIAGVVLASFPYTAELLGKIRYIRDFFITLFFIGLGMQIPIPTLAVVAKALLVIAVVLLMRWVGIFVVVWILGGGNRLAATATINLSQISEFALVICSLGKNFGHVEEDTMVILIWTFAILAIASSYSIGYNHSIYRTLAMLCSRCGRGGGNHASQNGAAARTSQSGHDAEEEHEGHDIILLGFHRNAAALVSDMEMECPAMLQKLHVIDFNEEVTRRLSSKGITCSYGDISCKDVLEHLHHGEARVVISSIPDSMLTGVSNAEILRISKDLWPNAHHIVTSDNNEDTESLYNAGASFVLQMSRLCSAQIQTLLTELSSTMHTGLSTKTNSLRASHVFSHFGSVRKETSAAAEQ